MNRRKFLATLGAATAGTSGAVGTGAFTSVSADRNVSVQVADDADAFLAMERSSGPNGEFANPTGDGTIALDFTDTDAGGTGLGTDSIYEFDDVFRVTNQGTQPVYVWATFADASGSFTPDGSDADIHLYPNGDSDNRLRDSDDDVLYLGVGQSAGIGVYVDTTDVTTDQNLTMTINANAENPVSASGAVVGGGGSPLGPVDGLVSYWPLDSIGDGTAEDVVGDNNGTVRGAVSSDSGQITQAASFDGTGSDFVEVPDDHSLGITGPYTQTAWVYINTSAGFKDITLKDPGQWAFGFQITGQKLRAGWEDEADNNYIGRGGSVPVETWTHVAVVYSGDAVRGYIDGAEVFDVTRASDGSGIAVADATPSTNDEPLRIGKGERAFDGRIDDLRLYNRALSDADVTELVNIGQE